MDCGGRFNFVWDANHDGIYTVSDVWLNFKWLFFVPGDLFVCAVLNVDSIRQFFEVTYASYSDGGSGVLSGLFWLIVFALVADRLENRHG